MKIKAYIFIYFSLTFNNTCSNIPFDDSINPEYEDLKEDNYLDEEPQELTSICLGFNTIYHLGQIVKEIPKDKVSKELTLEQADPKIHFILKGPKKEQDLHSYVLENIQKMDLYNSMISILTN